MKQTTLEKTTAKQLLDMRRQGSIGRVCIVLGVRQDGRVDVSASGEGAIAELLLHNFDKVADLVVGALKECAKQTGEKLGD
jgi:hypothetical protein